MLPYRVTNEVSGAGATPLLMRMALSVNRALPDSLRDSPALQPAKDYFRKKLSS
jgi:hypothetical protein